ncbi:OBERON 1-like protein, partial [Trifolium medium]|nr:OBERON 1-like protein [Trifolium medium]
CDIDGCKAGNHKCSSLILEKESPPVMPCDFCCAEPKFCRECCCILCYKAVDSTHGGCSYIMCKDWMLSIFAGAVMGGLN